MLLLAVLLFHLLSKYEEMAVALMDQVNLLAESLYPDQIGLYTGQNA